MTSLTRTDWVAIAALTILAAFAYVTTESAVYGDAPYYARDILSGVLIEPGHLLWRPLTWIFASVVQLKADPSSALWAIQYLCLTASLLSGVALYCVARSYFSTTVATLATAFFLFSNGYWAFAFSGSSYSLSVLFGILAWACVSPPAVGTGATPVSHARALTAGACTALAIATWGTQVVLLPVVWVAVMLADDSARFSGRRLASTVALGVGPLVLLLLPLVLLHAAADSVGLERYSLPRPDTLGLLAWYKSASHGISVGFQPSQLFRVFVGFPQSIVSISDIPQTLRLWMYGENRFPASAWIVVLPVFYLCTLLAVVQLRRGWNGLAERRRILVCCAALALAGNLCLAVLWQGTDLERYLPSLPLLALLVGLVLSQLETRLPVATTAIACAALTVVAGVNVVGTFRRVLAADSFKQRWISEIRRNTKSGDVVFVLGDRKAQIVDPHNPNFPRIVNVSYLIGSPGEDWRIRCARAIAEARENQQRIFVGESVLRSDNAPRDGWSFRQHPTPTANEIAEFFASVKADRAAFVVTGETVWEGK